MNIMSLAKEVFHYLRIGKYEFRRAAMSNERRAEEAYQGSMTSAMEVTREAAKVRTSTDFIRELMRDHG